MVCASQCGILMYRAITSMDIMDQCWSHWQNLWIIFLQPFVPELHTYLKDTKHIISLIEGKPEMAHGWRTCSVVCCIMEAHKSGREGMALYIGHITCWVALWLWWHATQGVKRRQSPLPWQSLVPAYLAHGPPPHGPNEPPQKTWQFMDILWEMWLHKPGSWSKA